MSVGNYIVTGSITGSFTSAQTANISFYAKGGNNEMSHYINVYGYTNSGSVTGSTATANHTLLDSQKYGIGTQWGKKSFVKAIPANIEAIKVVITGSIEGGGTLTHPPNSANNLAFDSLILFSASLNAEC